MNKLKEFLKTLKTNKRSRLIFLVAIIAIGIVVKIALFPKGPLQEGTPFTVGEYEEILDKKNLTKNGIPRDIEDFFMKGAEVGKALRSVKNKEIKKTTKNAILYLEKLNQNKLENYNNSKIMDRNGKRSGDIIHCINFHLPRESKEVLGIKFSYERLNEKRRTATLNADRYYGFKISKSVNLTRSECVDILNRDLNENL